MNWTLDEGSALHKMDANELKEIITTFKTVVKTLANSKEEKDQDVCTISKHAIEEIKVLLKTKFNEVIEEENVK